METWTQLSMVAAAGTLAFVSWKRWRDQQQDDELDLFEDQLESELRRVHQHWAPRGFSADASLIEHFGLLCPVCDQIPSNLEIHCRPTVAGNEAYYQPFPICKACAEKVHSVPDGWAAIKYYERLTAATGAVRKPSFLDGLPGFVSSELYDIMLEAIERDYYLDLRWMASHSDSCVRCSASLNENLVVAQLVSEDKIIRVANDLLPLAVPTLLCRDCANDLRNGSDQVHQEINARINAFQRQTPEAI